MTSAFRSKVLSSGALFLLLSGLALCGAKQPGAFALWGFVALLFVGATLLAPGSLSLSREFLAAFFLFLLGVFSSQILSLDSSVSLFWTTQILVYVFLALALKVRAAQDNDQESTAWGIGLCLLGLATALLTACQMIRRESPVGLLPINPAFNAAWMAALSVYLSGNRSKKRWLKTFSLAVSGLMALLVFAGPSRGGLIALGAGFIYAGFRLRIHTQRAFRILGLLALVVAALSAPWWISRFHLNAKDGLRGDRLKFWAVAVHAISDYPLTGYGLGNFELAYQNHAFPVQENAVRYGRTTEFAHNEYLQILACLGLPAGGLFLWIVYRRFKMPWRKNRPLDLPAKAGLTTLLVAALFNPIFHMPLLVFLALVFASQMGMGREPPIPTATGREWIWSGIFSLMVTTAWLLVWMAVRAHWASAGQWQRTIRWNPRDAAAWHAWGHQQSDVEQAIRAYEEAVRLSPRQPYYRESLGNALENARRSEDVPRALHAYLEAHLLAPSRAINLLAIGRLLYREGDPKTALLWIEQARRLEPYYWESDLWIARCLARLGQRKRAMTLLRNLPARRRQFERRFGPSDAFPSPYEQTILGYDERVVQREFKVLQAAHRVQ